MLKGTKVYFNSYWRLKFILTKILERFLIEEMMWTNKVSPRRTRTLLSAAITFKKHQFNNYTMVTRFLFQGRTDDKPQFRSSFAPQQPLQGEKVPFETALKDAQEEFNPKKIKGIVCVGETKTEDGEKAIIIFTGDEIDKNVVIPKEYEGYPVIQVEGTLSGMPYSFF